VRRKAIRLSGLRRGGKKKRKSPRHRLGGEKRTGISFAFPSPRKKKKKAKFVIGRRRRERSASPINARGKRPTRSERRRKNHLLLLARGRKGGSTQRRNQVEKGRKGPIRSAWPGPKKEKKKKSQSIGSTRKDHALWETRRTLSAHKRPKKKGGKNSRLVFSGWGMGEKEEEKKRGGLRLQSRETGEYKGKKKGDFARPERSKEGKERPKVPPGRLQKRGGRRP